MKWIFLLSCLLFFPSCTMQPSPEGMDVEVNIPLHSEHWVIRNYDDTNAQYCVIKSSHNGLKVILRKNLTNNTIRTAVKGTRRMHPGTNLHVRVNKHVYRSVTVFFPDIITDALINDLNHDTKVYLEWKRPSTNENGGNERFTNILPLQSFKQHHKTCMDSLT